ncbi:response regulator [Vreelandella sulfidaeris]|uniref:response regulator n=1 Tax=Vreelandella sulfidaeris TaxID=115553 RepID=UPI0035EAA029
MQRYQQEPIWNAIVWPLLWPLLLVQAALTLLCLVVGSMVWWMSPGYVSWSTTLWLMLALLIGSSLNVSVFLMLVKSRARRKDARFLAELTELEQHGQALCSLSTSSPLGNSTSATDADKSGGLPVQRLVNINARLASLERSLHRSQVMLAASDDNPSEHDQTMLQDLQQQRMQLKQLLAGRDRAREESRLKTGYLTLLQRETDSLFEHLTTMADKEVSDSCRQSILEVKEKLSDIRGLMENLVQDTIVELPKNERDSEQPTLSAPLRVLVVDDGPVNLMLARQMLETQGMQVEGVSSGEQALERQQSVHFDLVFMDIFMPTLNGLEATRRWREYERTHGQCSSVLVALTANADNAGRDACLAAGMDDLLAKPYQPETLLKIIANWFPNTLKDTPPK